MNIKSWLKIKKVITIFGGSILAFLMIFLPTFLTSQSNGNNDGIQINQVQNEEDNTNFKVTQTLGAAPKAAVSSLTVDSSLLSSIGITGDTKNIVIDDSNALAQARALNVGHETDFDQYIKVWYAIDNLDGALLNVATTNPLSFSKDDFIAYLKGELITYNATTGQPANSVVYANDHSHIVVDNFATSIAARVTNGLLASTDSGLPFTPDYLMMPLPRLESNSPTNAPTLKIKAIWHTSDATISLNDNGGTTDLRDVTLGNGFKKYLELDNSVNDEIAALEAHGTTKDASSWNLAYPTSHSNHGYVKRLDLTSDAALNNLGLKLQYSYDGVLWQSPKLNFTNDSALGTKSIFDFFTTSKPIYLRVVALGDNSTSAYKANDVFNDGTSNLKFLAAPGNTIVTNSRDGSNNLNFKIYYDGDALNAQIALLEANGNTQDSTTWNFGYPVSGGGSSRWAHIDLSKDLQNLGLKLQYAYSNAANTLWQDAKLTFSINDPDLSAHASSIFDFFSATNKPIFLRVVATSTPESYNGQQTNAIIDSSDGLGVNLVYTQSLGAKIKTDAKDSNNVTKFKIFLTDVTNNDLNVVKVTGNQLSVVSTDFDFGTAFNPTLHHVYSHVEVIFLYRGKWYNRDDLIAAFNAHKPLNDSWTAPSDFSNLSITARYRVLDPDNYTLKGRLGGQTEFTIDGTVTSAGVTWTTSNAKVVTSAAFRNFKNILNFQTSQNVFNPTITSLDDSSKVGQFAVINLTGTIAALNATLTLNRLSGVSSTFLSDNNLQMQWSTSENPSDLASNTSDWHTVSNLQFLTNVALDPVTKTLWVRFISNAPNSSVSSNYKNDGVGTTTQLQVNPIRIDVSKIKFQIDVDPSVLTGVDVSGKTQFINNLGLSVDLNQFLVANSANGAATGQFGLKGVNGIYTIDSNGATQPITSEQGVNQWVSDVGLTVRFKVTATRNATGTYQGKSYNYTRGNDYEFDKFDDLITALRSTFLNFNRDTLELTWGILPAKSSGYDVSSSSQTNPWVKPSDVSKLINVVYTEDIYNLTSDAYTIIGNDIKLTTSAISTTARDNVLNVSASAALAQGNLLTWGVQLEYNITPDPTTHGPSQNGWTTNPQFDNLDGARDYWMRFKSLDSNVYELDSLTHSSDPTQQVKVDNSNVKSTIVFTNYDTINSVITKLQNAAVVGKTYDFNWQNAGASNARDLPVFGTSKDGVTHGHIQYSHDGQTWGGTIAEALADTDYYHTGILSFDKDRGDALWIRYIYDENVGTSTPVINSNKWVFTDQKGNEFDITKLSRKIDISALIQPVFLQKSLALTTGSNALNYPGVGISLPDGSSGSDFSNATWFDLANSKFFQPVFKVSTANTKNAEFGGFTYGDNLRVGASTSYLFDLGRNPFTGDFEKKDDFSAFAPRNTHFEYSFRDSSSSAWSAWSGNVSLLNNLVKNSNETHLRVRLVANTGFELPTSYTTTNTFALDNSPRTSGKSITAENWTREFKVVTYLKTNGVQAAPGADQATFIGWDNPSLPTGTFKTDNADGNYNPVNDLANGLNNILIKFVDGSLVPYDPKTSNGILEWNVKNSANQDVIWTDSRGRVSVGWHFSGLTADEAPDPNHVPWYGAYPVSLKNGDIVQVRFRAIDGFVVKDDVNSTDYDASSKESRWSHSIDLKPVSGLTSEISVQNNFLFYDLKHLYDFYGHKITTGEMETGVPDIDFQNNEGHGTVNFVPNSDPKYKYEVAILHPWVGPNPDPNSKKSLFDQNQMPTYGYTTQDRISGKDVTIYYSVTSGNNAPGWVSDWTSHLKWVDPTTVTGLSVGDAIIVRLKANDGYGFKWEDTTNTFDDANYPKNYTQNAFGTQKLSPKPSYIPEDLNMNSNGGVVPIAVRGLKVYPNMSPKSITTLNVSTNPLESLNNANSVITVPSDKLPKLGEKWTWGFKVTRGSVTDSDWSFTIPRGLLNGDILRIIAIPVNDSYELDDAYDNTEQDITINILKEPLDGKFIPRPIIGITGYEGLGKITSFQPHLDATSQKDLWSKPDASYPFGRPILVSENGTPKSLVWEYQSTNLDPTNPLNEEKINNLPWQTTPPENLKYGDYVRVRVGTVNPNDIVLANGTDPIYSYNPSYDPTTPNVDENAAGWVRVQDLYLNPKNIDVNVGVTGFIQKTFVSSQFVQNTLDEANVTVEVSIDNGVTWVKLNDESLSTLNNGDKLRVRVVANEGHAFNPSDAVTTGNDQTIITSSVVNGVTRYYLEKSKWAVTIVGLKQYIDVKDVKLDPNVLTLVKSDNSPPLDSSGRLYDGFADISQIGIDPTSLLTVVNIDGNTSGTNSNGQVFYYHDFIGVRYVLQTRDPATGLPNPDVIYSDGNFPRNLSNGDHVIAELYSKNPDYQLSQNKGIELTVSGLVVAAATEVDDPVLVFIGRSGAGVVGVLQSAPPKTRWVFAVVHSGVNLPTIDEAFMKDDSNFVTTPPNNLRNGDFIIAKLASVFAGIDLNVANVYNDGRPVNIPMSLSWVPVIGLVEVINLSGLHYNNLFDVDNPYTPNKIIDRTKPNQSINYAFKLVGNQEGIARLEVNSPLFSNVSNERLVDSSGKFLNSQYARAAQWEFLVNQFADKIDGTYSRDLPTNLHNNDFVHVRLVSSDPNFVFEGFQVQTFEITNLEERPLLSSQTITLISSIVGGTVVAIAILSTVIYFRARGRKFGLSN